MQIIALLYTIPLHTFLHSNDFLLKLKNCMDKNFLHRVFPDFFQKISNFPDFPWRSSIFPDRVENLYKSAEEAFHWFILFQRNWRKTEIVHFQSQNITVKHYTFLVIKVRPQPSKLLIFSRFSLLKVASRLLRNLTK